MTANALDALEQEISDGLSELTDILSQYSTYSVVGTCFGKNFGTEHDIATEDRLTSPAKQVPFLLGVLLSTEEPSEPGDFGEEQWNQVKPVLDSLFFAYMRLYMPEDDEISDLSEEWHHVREVAMSAFLHYFNVGLLASIEQIAERIELYLVPFDHELSTDLGISASEALTICIWIRDELQTCMDQMTTTAKDEQAKRHALLDRAIAEGWSKDKLIKETQDSDYGNKARQLFSHMDNLGKVFLLDLEEAFPDSASDFWSLFTVARGAAAELRYPTERSEFEAKPLIRLNEQEAMCPIVNQLFGAVLSVGEQHLLASDSRNRYLQARDKTLESEVTAKFKPFFPAGAKVWENVYETPESNYEHDTIIVDDELCLVVESKAKPPIEPFRDPGKAFTRLRHAFRSDGGIQKGFEQANPIVKKLKAGEVVLLYDKRGDLVGTLEPNCAKRIVAVVVTRDNYGLLATNLALLLEKDADDSFPWVTNVFDLANLGMAWDYLKWGSSELREYIEQRIELHGTVYSEDELDYAGYYIRHGELKSTVSTKADIVQLNPEYSSLFDDIYRHVHLSGPPFVLDVTPPVMMDLRKSLTQDEPVFIEPAGRPVTKAKIGRNSPCPCGSGKKYKKCCGRHPDVG
jgi:hypothetical protein